MASKKVSSIPNSIVAVYDGIVRTVAGVERKGDTMPYTSVNGHMFSFLAKDGSMALRLPATEIQKMIEEHNASLCQAHGTVLKEYVSVPDAIFNNAHEIAVYFRKSYEYVSSLKPKATTKTAAAKTGSTAAKAKIIVWACSLEHKNGVNS